MAMWVKGEPWRVVLCLEKLNSQIRSYAPRSVPPATNVDAWGSIADDAHSTSSDHYPHFYSVLGSTAVVCARDFPHAPTLGLDGGKVTEALRVSRDARIGYVIFNRRITGPNHGWQWETYTGSDPHDTHFHVSSVHTALADNQAPWALPGPFIPANTSGNVGDAMLYILPNGNVYNENGVQITNAESIDARTKNYNSAVVLAVPSMARMQELTTARTAPVTASVDVAQLASALAPLLNVQEADLLGVLQSPEGQAALTQAANTAEDS